MLTRRSIDATTADVLRVPVLRPGAAPGYRLPATEQPGGLTLGVFDSETLVGTALVFAEPYPLRPDSRHAWRMRYVAVDTDRQGTGVGRELVAFTVAEVAARGGRLLWCDARMTALPFYERLGFLAEGPVFTPATIDLEHRRMYLELTAAPVSSS